MKRGKRLRELFKRPGIIRIVGAHNGLTAKLVEEAGFDGVWASGLEISTSYGVPDANVVTIEEFLRAARSMNEHVDIPVVADCNTGFGSSDKTARMVKRYERAGIAAICIEDKLPPKVNSYLPGRQELTPISDFAEKITVAKNAQEGGDLMVIARVEALIAGRGIEEALRRADAYRGAGADAILIHSRSKTPDEIFRFAKRWQKTSPLVAIPTTYHTVTSAELEEIGIKMVIYANYGIRAAIRAIEEIFAEIEKTGTTTHIEGKIVDIKKLFELQGISP